MVFRCRISGLRCYSSSHVDSQGKVSPIIELQLSGSTATCCVRNCTIHLSPNLPGGIQKESHKNVRERLIVCLKTSRIGPSKGPRIRDEGVANSLDKLNKTYYDMSVP